MVVAVGMSVDFDVDVDFEYLILPWVSAPASPGKERKDLGKASPRDTRFLHSLSYVRT